MSIEKLNACIKNKKANNSRAREAIYSLLLHADECLTVSQIIETLPSIYPKKISQNTLYRHLNFFIECKFVVVIQDDFKRAYYYLKKDEVFMLFCVCTTCTRVTRLDIPSDIEGEIFKNTEFITVHKRCDKCIK